MTNAPLRGCPLCSTPIDNLDLGLRDYRWVTEALPGKVAPMDMDFVLERNGHVLIQEYKPEGAPLPLGQRLTLKTFVRMGCDVWVVWEGEKKVQVGMMDRYGNVAFIESMTPAKFKRKTTEWYEEANADG